MEYLTKGPIGVCTCVKLDALTNKIDFLRQAKVRACAIYVLQLLSYTL
jgi:hypothetical protein